MRFDSHLWRVTTAPSSESDVTEDDRAEAARTINARLTAIRERLALFPEAWLQELLLEGFLNRMMALFVAERFAAKALADPQEPHRISGSRAEVCPEMIAYAFRRAGMAIHIPWTVRWRRTAQHLATALLALGGFLLLAVRTALWPSRLVPGRRRIAAIHAETVNRTRYVLGALKQLNPADSAVLVVGRPQIGCRAIERMLRKHEWSGPFVFPLDLLSALTSLRGGLGVLRRGACALETAGMTLAARDQLAANFRILLGAGNSSWADRQPFEAGAGMVFGHSGRADTISLERAVQDHGVGTVHWVHGLSVGHAYTGVSDLGVWQCAHDAQWHDRLGGYRQNIAFSLSKPNFVPAPAEDRRWLVMTNFTHYGYTFFGSSGPAHEFRLIELMEEVADRLSMPPGNVTWKPHPVFWQRDPDIRQSVLARLERAKFDLWPESERNIGHALTYGKIITTPSGIAVDILKLGRLPVMVQFHEVDPEHALAKFKLRGHDADSLIRAAIEASAPIRGRQIFDDLWQAIQPAGPPNIDETIAHVLRN